MPTANSGTGQLPKSKINVYHDNPQISENCFLQHIVLLYEVARVVGDRLKYPQS